jgi:hypothetical protein
MPTEVSCPKCKRKGNVPDKMLGKKVKCPGCARIFVAGARQAPAAKNPADDYEVVEDEVVDDVVVEDEVVEDEVIEDEVVEDDDEGISEKPRSRRRPAADDDEAERPRKSSRGRDEEDDDEDRSRRYRRDRDDDDDDEDDRPRPRRKKKTKRRSRSSGGSLPAILIPVIGGLGLCVVFVALAIFVPAMGLLVLGLGCLLALVGTIWIVVIAFQDSALSGVLCFCFWPYRLYYAITHFDETKYPFIIDIVGEVMILVANFSGGAGGLDNGPAPPPRRRVEWHPPAAVAAAGPSSYLPSRPSAALASTVRSASGTPFARPCSISLADGLPTASNTSTARRPWATSGTSVLLASVPSSSSSCLWTSADG